MTAPPSTSSPNTGRLLQHSTRVLCCCSAGQVRSVCAKFCLTDVWLFRRVLSMGLDKTESDTAETLFKWADVILVVGEAGLVDRVHAWHRGKVKHIDVGPDVWGRFGHEELVEKVKTALGELIMAETAKAYVRRVREGWFEKYAPDHMSGIDLGCQRDFLNHTFRRWDAVYGDGDATDLEGVPDGVFHTVYASHLLEHLADPIRALKNWYRVLRPGGHLVVVVPHRDLYEKKRDLPSLWNSDHKTYWLPDSPAPGDPPHTKGLRAAVLGAIGPGAPERVVYVRVLDEGFESHGPTNHSGGEYSTEVVVRKPPTEFIGNGF